MMSFCLKSINSLFFGLSNDQEPEQSFKNTNHFVQQPESLIMKKDEKVVGFEGLGFLYGDTGMSCCTESLGCESSDRMEDEELEEMKELAKLRSSKVNRSRIRRDEVKKFPPPLTSLNQNGHPSFYMKPERRDGRLILTEVRINRPEILRASRQDGRLTLHLILPEPETELEPEDCESENEHEDVNEPEVNITEEIETEERKEEEADEEEEEEREDEEQEEEEEEVMTEQHKLKFPFTSGGGESYRGYKILSNGKGDHSPSFGRCHLMSNHYHHHPLWSNNCVTSG